MNIQNLLVMQKNLDEVIVKNNQINDSTELLDNTVMACLVEVGEFANEIEFFKHWKKNKRNNREKQLDEYADVMHFILSIINQTDSYSEEYEPEEFVKIHQSTNISDLLNIDKAFKVLYKQIIAKDGLGSLITLLFIANKVGFTLEEIDTAYKIKNRINYERQKNNY